MRGVTVSVDYLIGRSEFLLTRLMRGVTGGRRYGVRGFVISTHTPHARRDQRWKCCRYTKRKFLLTRLMRGVTFHAAVIRRLCKFLLTRLMRGVTAELERSIADIEISTHTPHARRDILL